MPSVTFDGQSLSVKGRRIWLSAAEFHYLLTPRTSWGDCLHSLSQAGFNTVVLPCAWSMHEERTGRFDFTAGRALRSAIELCAELGFWVVLKAGPVVGNPYSGGGLPAWISDIPGVRLREPKAPFLERVSAWLRAVAGQSTGLLATDVASTALRRLRLGAETGPVVAVQLEHQWHCAQESIAEHYLSELIRFAREVGFAVPIMTANDSFAFSDAAPDAIVVGDEPLALMRQLTALRPTFPRFGRVGPESDESIAPESAAVHAERMALVLAGGGQFLLSGALELVGPARMGPQRPGLIADASGNPNPQSGPIRRVAHFAASFGHVLAQSEPGRTPMVIDPSGASDGTSVIPVSGPGGTVVFVVSPTKRAGRSEREKGQKPRKLSILAPDGRSFPVSCGATGIDWFVFGVDVFGKTRIDYATISPIAHANGSTILFAGPAGDDAEISIDGVPLALKVPQRNAGSTPTIARVHKTTVIVCNEEQADAALASTDSFVIGARETLTPGRFRLLPGYKSATRVTHDGQLKPLAKEAIVAESPRRAAITVSDWTIVPTNDYADGTSHRFATLNGPASLAACGARDGYGWYRVSFRRSTAGKVLLHGPELADHAVIWHNGSLLGAFDVRSQPSTGASKGFPLEMKLAAGQHVFVLLVSERPRPTSGHRIGRRAGLFGPMVEVSPIKSGPKIERNVKVDPFALGVIQDLHPGDVRPGIALTWKLPKRTSDRFVIDLDARARSLPGGATITLNGTPIARWNADGPEGFAVMFAAPVALVAGSGRSSARQTAGGRAGQAGAYKQVTKEELLEVRMVLDQDMSDADLTTLTEGARLFEVIGELGASPQYAFARWAAPSAWPRGSVARVAKGTSAPFAAWFGGSITLERAPQHVMSIRLDAQSSMTLFANGVRCGIAEAGAALAIAPDALRIGRNELALFDETGVGPGSLTIE
jgi:Glycosyl hydrolases family 35